MEINKLCLADCKDYLKDVPDGSVDMILTDPPYDINIGKNIHNHGYHKEQQWRPVISYKTDWDKGFNPSIIEPHIKRVLKPTGSVFIFTSDKLFGKWYEMLESLFYKVGFFVWHKTNPMFIINKDNFISSCELILFAFDKNKYFNYTGHGKEMHNFIETPMFCNWSKECLMDGKRKLHPTQKPLKILTHLLNIACPECGLVLDPFMGTGSTAVAALNMKMNFIGCEIEEKYFKMAEKRIENIKKNQTLF